MRSIGIPIKQVGERLEALNKALKEHGMAVGAESVYRVTPHPKDGNIVISINLDVYLFEKED